MAHWRGGEGAGAICSVRRPGRASGLVDPRAACSGWLGASERRCRPDRERALGQEKSSIVATSRSLDQDTVGKSGSIALIERFLLSLKNECTRRILVPLHLGDLRAELSLYGQWYGAYRPHQGLDGRTPNEVYEAGKVEPFRLRAANDCNERDPPKADLARAELPRLELRVCYLEGRRHLPIVELGRAA
jgi:hypothetical protein